MIGAIFLCFLIINTINPKLTLNMNKIINSLVICFIFLSSFSSIAITNKNVVKHVVAKDSTTTINYKVINGIIVLPIKINSKSYQFIFDTGASYSVLSNHVLNEITYKKIDSVVVRDANNTVNKLKTIEISEIFIGEKKIEAAKSVVLSSAIFSKLSACDKVDGILGFDVINKIKWRINPVNQTIIISNDVKYLDVSKDAYKIKLKTTDRKAIAIVKLNGYKTFLKIDSGCNQFFIVNDHVYKNLKQKNKINDSISSKGFISSSLFGKNIGKLNKLFIKKVEVGDITLKNQIITNSKKSNNLLGNGFFNNFHVILDIAKKQLFLEPIGDLLNNNISGFEIGLMPDYESGKVVVKNIWETNLSENNISINSEIIRVNNIDVSNFTKEDLCLFWSKDFSDILKFNEIHIEYIENKSTHKVRLERKQLLPKI